MSGYQLIVDRRRARPDARRLQHRRHLAQHDGRVQQPGRGARHAFSSPLRHARPAPMRAGRASGLPSSSNRFDRPPVLGESAARTAAIQRMAGQASELEPSPADCGSGPAAAGCATVPGTAASATRRRRVSGAPTGHALASPSAGLLRHAKRLRLVRLAPRGVEARDPGARGLLAERRRRRFVVQALVRRQQQGLCLLELPLPRECLAEDAARLGDGQ